MTLDCLQACTPFSLDLHSLGAQPADEWRPALFEAVRSLLQLRTVLALPAKMGSAVRSTLLVLRDELAAHLDEKGVHGGLGRGEHCCLLA